MRYIVFFLCGLLAASSVSWANDAVVAPQTYLVGVAKRDITPDYPVRLSGFGFRRTESEGVTQRIWAKALAIGADNNLTGERKLMGRGKATSRRIGP